MKNALYGKVIERSFIADDELGAVALPTQTPTIYLFPYGTIPSRADAIAGTGALQTVSSWTQSPINEELTYSYTAVVDPDPNGAEVERDYWEAINYVLATSGQSQLKLRSFKIKRAEVIESTPATTAADIEAVWPAVVNYLTSAQLSSHIAEAEMLTRADINTEIWPRVSGLNQLKFCIAYQTIVCAATSQVVKGNSDKFVWMVDQFKEKYNSLIAKINLQVDLDGDGRPDMELKVSESVVFSAR